MIKLTTLLTLLLITCTWATGTAETNRRAKGGSKSKGKRKKKLTLTITNLAFQQPFSPFFVMVHNEHAEPLFTLGSPSSAELAELAENGNATDLAASYDGSKGVLSAVAFTDDAPTFAGEKLEIPVFVNDKYPYVTIASMAINTNDCFVAIPGMKLYAGDSVVSPGYDSGTEKNNELCKSIPGPACPDDSGNEASGEGEGVVHVHRGFHGVGDLSEAGYDWRNPMMLVEVH